MSPATLHVIGQLNGRSVRAIRRGDSLVVLFPKPASPSYVARIVSELKSLFKSRCNDHNIVFDIHKKDRAIGIRLMRRSTARTTLVERENALSSYNKATRLKDWIPEERWRLVNERV